MKNYGNIYKTSRNSAAFTQEHAAEILHISPRTLSDYENGKTIPADDIVKTMSEKYRTPELPYQHMKCTSVLGKFLPDIIMPKSHEAMAWQIVLAHENLQFVVDDVKRIMANGYISNSEKASFYEPIELVKQVNAKLFSVIIYAG